MSEFRQIKIDALAAAGWCADDLQEDCGQLEISGWSLDLEPEPQFAMEGASDGRFALSRHERPDIDAIFPFFPKSGPRGFAIRIPAALSVADGGLHWRLRRDRDSFSYYEGPADWKRALQLLPDSGRRFRVHGSSDLSGFILEGCSAAAKIVQTLEGLDLAGRPAGEADVLDWGCGCGRVSRWLTDRFGSLSGCDIDADNAGWCAQYFATGGRWLSCALQPPLPFEMESFDAIFGISVFTHLSEQAQFTWLEELRRILRPGGLCMVTVHGLASAARFALPDPAWSHWLNEGFFDLGPSEDLRAVFGDHDHYRGSLHTERYVRERWSEVMTVEGYYPSVIGNHQDVVLLRK